MTIKRLAPNQFALELPLGEAREAVWHAFEKLGAFRPVIDPALNQVAGYLKLRKSANLFRVVARFESGPEGVVVSFDKLIGLLDPFDRRAAREATPRLVKALMNALASAPPSKAPAPLAKVHANGAEPIAEPSGEVVGRRPTGPVYGTAPAAGYGSGVYYCGVFCAMLDLQITFVVAQWPFMTNGKTPAPAVLLWLGWLLALIPVLLGFLVLKIYELRPRQTLKKVFLGMLAGLLGGLCVFMSQFNISLIILVTTVEHKLWSWL